MLRASTSSLRVDGGRRSGQTTALVDIALMNARLGGEVHFWSADYPRSDHAFRIAARRAFGIDPTVRVSNSLKMITFDKGRVTFVTDRYDPRGYAIDMAVIDDDNVGFVNRYE